VLIACDPGRCGAFCKVDFDEEVVEFIDIQRDDTGVILPSTVDALKGWYGEAATAVSEEIWGRGGQASTATFIQGQVYGQCLLLLREGWGTYELVAPITWKSALKLVAPKGSTAAQRKNITLQAARQWFPWAAEHLKLAKHNDRADALCIAYWQHAFGGQSG